MKASGVPPELVELARWSGIQTSYTDMAGRTRALPPDSLLEILRVLGVPIERVRDAGEALQAARRARSLRMMEPVHVIWKQRPAPIRVQLPSRVSEGTCHGWWHLESGETKRIEFRGNRAAQSNGGKTLWLVPPPRGLPIGYHRFAVECSRAHEETHVFCAPERCFEGRPARRWGIFAPHYALHSNQSWGAADLGDLRSFVSWIARKGGRFFGTLPLLPQFLGEPCEPSPYSPVSRLFWNDFLIDLSAVPEFQNNREARRLVQSTAFQKTLERLRRLECVDYQLQMAQKRRVLEILANAFFSRPSPRRSELEAFVEAHPEIPDYARFRAVQEAQGTAWQAWPSRLRNGTLRPGDCPAALYRYHLYVQWLVGCQMKDFSQQARREQVDLYLDVPLGTHRDGYDTWRHQSLFAREASGGAPPDPVFTRGQDWGFAPLHPERSREQGHLYFRSCLRHHLEHARMLRFDHVMGLHRLYWVPTGRPAKEGAYVRYPAEEYYAILSIESHRHRAEIIGENLGTVPPEVDRALGRHGVAGMHVVQYELRPGRVPLRSTRPKQAASLNTHDMPPFAAFWAGLDIEDRAQLRLIGARQRSAEHKRRKRLQRSLIRYLQRGGWLKRSADEARDVFEALVRQLSAGPARWVMLNLEDLWLETASQNTPGTTTERVNWRRKARWTIEQLGDASAPPGILCRRR